MGGQNEVIANISFSISEARKICCKDNGPVPGSFSPSYHHFRKLGCPVGVELEPKRAARCVGNFLNAAGCKRTGRHQGACHANSLSGCTFALGMCHALVSRRRHNNRHAHRCAQDSGAQFEVTHIDEHARTKPDALKSCAVGPQGYLVVAAALVEVPGGRVHSSLSKYFVIVEVDWFHKAFLTPFPSYAARSTLDHPGMGVERLESSRCHRPAGELPRGAT